MTISIPKEMCDSETRVALVPDHVGKLVRLGARVMVESGAGPASGHGDDAYITAGAVVAGRAAVLADGDFVFTVGGLRAGDEVRHGTLLAGFLDPFGSAENIRRLAAQGVSALSLEMLPRSTRAQKMDALSSQASLAGYVAVILAAEHSRKIFPMMMTPAGTLLPSHVFVIGAGVAGLQAIATAKRLGAKVEAYDTRPVVAEQVRSLGARFVTLDLGGDGGQTKDGYATALTPAQIERQRDGMTKVCAASDVVITTALLFGRRAPVLVTANMLAAMRPGSVVVDLAAAGGGNVEGVEPGAITQRDGVTIIGLTNLPGRVPFHASQMFSSNLCALLEEFWDKHSKRFLLKPDDDIIKSCLVTHDGRIVNEKLAAT
jgi:H+-translocating NAD(P) transhydrogenase subunit alpha